MNLLNKKNKLFIIITLAILVVGMTLLGIFGFNQTVDYKDSYELRVSIEQNAGNAKTILLNSTENYFEKNNIKPAKYAFQSLDEGKTLIYKFAKDANIDTAKLVDEINAKLTEGGLTGVNAVVEYSTVEGNNKFDAGWLILALSIGVVATFVYALILEKLSGATATVASAVLSPLAFVALMAITRLPAYPLLGATIALSMIAASVLSVATSARFREEFKIAEGKPSAFEIAQKVMKEEVKKYYFTAIAFAVLAVAISVFFVPYMMIAGAQVLLAGLCALASSYFVTPIVWSLIKDCKKNKK